MAANDIQTLLLQIKDGIARIEAGELRREILNDIERDFLQMLELIKLFLISERDTYYGYFLMSMRFQAEFGSNSIAGIRLGEYPPLFVSNPLILCKFELREILYVVCHEIEHVALNHPAEMLRANPEKDPKLFELFNLAADASVNDRLDQEVAQGRKFLKAPEGAVSSRTLRTMFELPWLQKLENYQYYYDAICDTGIEPPESGPERMVSQLVKGAGDEQPEGEPGDEADGTNAGGADSGGAGAGDDASADAGAADAAGADDDGLGDVVTAANCGKPSDHEWEDEESQLDAEEVGYAVRELMNAAVDLMNEESRGLMPAGFMQAVARINEPPRLSWEQILKKYVGTISAGKRKTRSRLNRRQPTRFDLSGAVDEKTLKIVVAIDTSGSVDDQQVAQIFNEIFSIIAHRRFEMTVIECDAQVQRTYRVRTRSDVQLSVLGRGGTAFTPVIELINNDRYYRDALLIYFTDGWGERSIPRPLTYRNLWVLTSGTYLSVSEPYGTVVSMDGGVVDAG